MRLVKREIWPLKYSVISNFVWRKPLEEHNGEPLAEFNIACSNYSPFPEDIKGHNPFQCRPTVYKYISYAGHHPGQLSLKYADIRTHIFL